MWYRSDSNNIRERKMRTKFFCTTFLNTPRRPGHPGKNPGTSQIPRLETQGRQTFEGGHEVFGHHPFEWKTPTPPGGLRTQKVYLCALFSRSDSIAESRDMGPLRWDARQCPAALHGPIPENGCVAPEIRRLRGAALKVHRRGTAVRVKRGPGKRRNSCAIAWPGPSAEMCRGFLLKNFWGFCQGFSWRIFLGTFSHKNDEKKSAKKSAKQSGGPKRKICEKSVLPKTDPKIARKRQRHSFQKELVASHFPFFFSGFRGATVAQ